RKVAPQERRYPRVTRRILLSWSSGKDSAWALHQLRRHPDTEAVGLLTIVNDAAARASMPAVRRVLVQPTAAAAGQRLCPVTLPVPCANHAYEERMSGALRTLRREGVTHIAFGDLYLEDVRAYRERQLAGTGIEPLFPLWSSRAETPRLARRMLDAGLQAV